MTNTKKKWTKCSMTPGRGKHGRGFGLEGWVVCMGVWGEAGGNAFHEENCTSYPDAKKQAAVLGTDAVLKLSI